MTAENTVKESGGVGTTGVGTTAGTVGRDARIHANMRLVRIIAHQVVSNLPGHIDVNDLISAGTVGLLEAVDRFDESKGVQMSTYASIRIRGAIMDELRGMDWMTRSMRDKSNSLERAYAAIERKVGRPAQAEEVASYLNVSNDELHGMLSEVCAVGVLSLEDMGVAGRDEAMDILECIKDEEAKDPMAMAKLAEIKKSIKEAVEALPEKEKLVVSLYYYDELTMKEIGGILSITESRVCQLHSQIMSRLKVRLMRYGAAN